MDVSELVETVWRVFVAAVYLYAAHMAWWWKTTDRPALQPPRVNLAIWLTGLSVWYALLALADPHGPELEPWWTGSSRVLNTGLAIAVALVVKARNGHHER